MVQRQPSRVHVDRFFQAGERQRARGVREQRAAVHDDGADAQLRLQLERAARDAQRFDREVRSREFRRERDDVSLIRSRAHGEALRRRAGADADRRRVAGGRGDSAEEHFASVEILDRPSLEAAVAPALVGSRRVPRERELHGFVRREVNHVVGEREAAADISSTGSVERVAHDSAVKPVGESEDRVALSRLFEDEIGKIDARGGGDGETAGERDVRGVAVEGFALRGVFARFRVEHERGGARERQPVERSRARVERRSRARGGEIQIGDLPVFAVEGNLERRRQRRRRVFAEDERRVVHVDRVRGRALRERRDRNLRAGRDVNRRRAQRSREVRARSRARNRERIRERRRRRVGERAARDVKRLRVQRGRELDVPARLRDAFGHGERARDAQIRVFDGEGPAQKRRSRKLERAALDRERLHRLRARELQRSRAGLRETVQRRGNRSGKRDRRARVRRRRPAVGVEIHLGRVERHVAVEPEIARARPFVDERADRAAVQRQRHHRGVGNAAFADVDAPAVERDADGAVVVAGVRGVQSLIEIRFAAAPDEEIRGAVLVGDVAVLQIQHAVHVHGLRRAPV